MAVGPALGGRTGNTGIVDQHVEAAQVSDRLVEQMLHGLAVGHIAPGLGDRGIGPGKRRQRRIIDVARVNLGAFADEGPRDGQPDAVGACRHQHAQAVDVEIHSHSGKCSMTCVRHYYAFTASGGKAAAYMAATNPTQRGRLM